MRRILIFILCCLMLTTAAAAAGRMDDVLSTTVVYPDGTADVVLTVKITLGEAQTGLTFPLPAGAENVRLNNAAVEPRNTPDNPAVVLVDLSGVCSQAGTFSLDFRYSLKDLVYADGQTNIYVWMEYYDQQTGKFRMEGDGQWFNANMGNTCTGMPSARSSRFTSSGGVPPSIRQDTGRSSPKCTCGCSGERLNR